MSNEWPREATASLRRLTIPSYVQLHWGEESALAAENRGGAYQCPFVVVRKYPQRGRMLQILEHELRHAHQDGGMPGRCFSSDRQWEGTTAGQEWVAAMKADHNAGLWVDVDGQTVPHENEAQFYAWWIRADWPPGQSDDLCFDGKSKRCRIMEREHGPRPSRYP